MRYFRSYELQVSHFSDIAPDGKSVYPRLELARASKDVAETRKLYEAILCGIHGHNLVVEVTVDGPVRDGGFVVDDPVISSVVMGFDNWNLSMHPALAGHRATTENLAQMFFDQIWKAINDATIRLTVRIEERAGLEATCSSKSNLR